MSAAEAAFLHYAVRTSLDAGNTKHAVWLSSLLVGDDR